MKTWAGLLGETEAQSLLEQTLNEEKEADEKLTELLSGINLEAAGSEEVQDDNLEEFEAETEGSTDKPLKSKSRAPAHIKHLARRKCTPSSPCISFLPF